jgi:hypothetical protein
VGKGQKKILKISNVLARTRFNRREYLEAAKEIKRKTKFDEQQKYAH